MALATETGLEVVMCRPWIAFIELLFLVCPCCCTCDSDPDPQWGGGLLPPVTRLAGAGCLACLISRLLIWCPFREDAATPVATPPLLRSWHGRALGALGKFAIWCLLRELYLLLHARTVA